MIAKAPSVWVWIDVFLVAVRHRQGRLEEGSGVTWWRGIRGQCPGSVIQWRRGVVLSQTDLTSASCVTFATEPGFPHLFSGVTDPASLTGICEIMPALVSV